MNKKEIKFIDKCLIFVGVCIAIFIVVMIFTFWKFQQIPDTLVTAVLGTGGVELIVAGFIAISGNIRRKDDSVHNQSTTTDIVDNEHHG